VAIFSFLILKEELGLQKASGIVIVVSGLFLAQLKPKSKVKNTTDAVEVHRK